MSPRPRATAAGPSMRPEPAAAAPAAKTVPEDSAELRDTVRDRYAKAAVAAGEGSATCCGDAARITEEQRELFGSGLYDAGDRDDLPEAAQLASLGCGNPTAVAELHEGETVLDLGSGGGIDVLLSARRVGPTGKAYGLDMTDEMLDLARQNQREAGIENVEFVKGTIEDVPATRRLDRRDHQQLRDQPHRRTSLGSSARPPGSCARVVGSPSVTWWQIRTWTRPRGGTWSSGPAASPGP